MTVERASQGRLPGSIHAALEEIEQLAFGLWRQMLVNASDLMPGRWPARANFLKSRS